jgi:flagellar motility protein MotE (MotC chaperone)
LELRQRRSDLDARDAALASRESMLQAAEHKLQDRVGELEALQKKLEQLDAARKDREDANWRGLVKTYENMKPRDAATIFNDLDMAVLLQVVDRMKEAKAAPVLAAMQPDKARQVTSGLAEMRAKANAMAADPPPTPSGAGERAAK